MDESALKGGGFIKLRQPDRWAIRVRVLFGEISPAQMRALADISERFGDGELHLTVRQGIEVRGVKVEDFAEVKAALEEAGLGTGACGPRVRLPVACPGAATCKRGLCETGPLATALYESLYGREDLPHKFKCAVSGCNASCAKPQLNDIGFLGAVRPKLVETDEECIACAICVDACPEHAITLDDAGRPIIDEDLCDGDGACVASCPTGALRSEQKVWRAFVGGKVGKTPAIAYELPGLFSGAEAVELAKRVLDAYEKYGKVRERLRDTIDRIGLDAFIEEVLEDADHSGP